MTDVLRKERVYFGLSIQGAPVQCGSEGTTEAGRGNSTVAKRTGKQNETNKHL